MKKLSGIAPDSGTLMTLAVILMVSASACGCISSSDTADGTGTTSTIIDMAGRTVEIPQSIDGFVAIEAGALRYAVYAGGADRIVGVEDVEFSDSVIAPVRPYNFAHPEFSLLPSIGPIHGGDSELIASLEPDVIFWTYATAEDADALFAQTGIPVVCIVYGDLLGGWDTFCQALRIYGNVLGTDDIVEQKIGYIQSLKDDLDRRSCTILEEDMPSAYVGGVACRGPHSIESTNPVYEPFELLGADNVAAELGTTTRSIDPEILLTWDPDYIFVDESSYAVGVFDDLNSGLYSDMSAIVDKNVYGVMPYNWYTANWSTVLADAYYIGKVLYPEEFDDIEIDTLADEIYTNLVGAPVYGDMCGYYEGLTCLAHHME